MLAITLTTKILYVKCGGVYQLNDDWQLSFLWSDCEKERYNFLKQRQYSRSLSVITVKYTITSIMKGIWKLDKPTNVNVLPLWSSGANYLRHRNVLVGSFETG